MNVAQQLNLQFGIAGQLNFRADESGLILAEISNAQATALLCLQGAHLMAWQPRKQAKPVVWLSRDARLIPGKSIRGGVPVCWPWFGAHVSNPDFPAHGFARTSSWKIIESGIEPNGATCLTMQLEESVKAREWWPHDAALELTVIAGDILRMELSTINTGARELTVSEALHTYFQVSDIGSIRINGLDGCSYWNKAGGSTLEKQEGVIRFSGETDRVYINTTAECAIEDEGLKRRIRVAKSGSLSTVVWSPWVEKAARMGDLGQPDGWRKMVCVESANALENTVRVAPGAKHTLVVEYCVEPL